MTRVRHTTNAPVAFVLFSVAYFFILFLWWQLFPYQTATVDVPIEVLNEKNEIRPGDNINLLVVFDKQSDVTPEVSRNIICNTGSVYDVVAPSGGRARPTGKFIAEVNFGLTERAIPGEICVFEFINKYHVNPIRTVTKKWQSEPFEVVK